MNAKQLLDEILPILYTVKEDPVKLQKILTFLEEEIYEEPDEEEEIKIPDRFKEIIPRIAESIDCGFLSSLSIVLHSGRNGSILKNSGWKGM